MASHYKSGVAIVSALVLFAVMVPRVVFGQTITGILDTAGGIVGRLIPIVAGVALLVFFWGLVRFIASAGSEDGRKAGKQIMLWGIIALFVMIAIWGIVAFIRVSLGVNQEDNPNAPCLRGLPGCPSSGGSSGGTQSV
ncbi:pilin [Candidatus Wolfebacteria bacterium]|nr:pilin [Candidatus Wolfebacteria bacterium]